MKDVSKNALQKIKQEKVRPYPKWHFVFKRSVIWTLFCFSILTGSIAAGIAIFQLKSAEWDIYKHLSHSFLECTLLIIPYFWLFFMIGFTGFAYYYFRSTGQGYKYNTLWVVLGSIVLSIIGGGILFTTEAPEKIETIFEDEVPFYRMMQNYKQKIWMSPEQGLLAGKITKIISKQKMQIKDLHGNMWVIDTAATTWRGRFLPAENLRIKILGNIKCKSQFIANEIRPWKGRRDKCRMHHKKRCECKNTRQMVHQ